MGSMFGDDKKPEDKKAESRENFEAGVKMGVADGEKIKEAQEKDADKK